MIENLRNLLKQNRLTHALAKRTRNFFLPHFRLPDLAAAWNTKYYQGAALDQCFALYRKNRDCQRRLAAGQTRQAMPRRYLGPEWVSNIGTLAHIDSYAKIGMLGWRPPQETFLVAYPQSIGNPFFLRLWGKYFSILDDPAELKRLLRDILLFQDYHLVMELGGKVDLFPRMAAVVQREWEKQQRGPLLELDEETKQRGRDYLASLGMPRDGWFVTMHIRENGYKPGEEHDRCPRNAHIESYLPAIKKIVARGGWVIRCGDAKMVPLPKMDQVFDYAFCPERRDWLDIFFASQCRFLIGTQSGLSHVGDTFGVPTLYTNWVCWGFPPWYNTTVFLPKRFWSREKIRTLSLQEIVAMRLGCCENPDVLEARGIKLIDNKPEELEASVEQMLRETEAGSWQPRSQVHIQKRFAAADIILNGRLSDGFLEKHEHLI